MQVHFRYQAYAQITRLLRHAMAQRRRAGQEPLTPAMRDVHAHLVQVVAEGMHYDETWAQTLHDLRDEGAKVHG